MTMLWKHQRRAFSHRSRLVVVEGHRDNPAVTQAGEQLAAQIQDELVCPECQYSLRGLPGEIVICPECGNPANIASLVASHWRGPWYRAPLYNTLALPLAWGFLASMFSLIALVIVYRNDTPPDAVFYVLMLLISGGWVALLVFVWRKFGSREGLWLALLLHAVLPAYTLGAVAVIGMIIKIVVDFGSYRWLLPYDCLWLVVSLGIIVGARLTERFVGRRCIRRHLRLRAAVGTMQK